MQLSVTLRARISALGELSRPLGETRAATLARGLANAVAKDVALGRDPERTIDSWIRQIAIEIVEKSPPDQATASATPRMRRVADVLPEIY